MGWGSFKKAFSGGLGSNSIGGSLFGSGFNINDPMDLSGGTAREYNSAEAYKQRQWSSEEADKQRQWQTEMANTVHQREVADLKAAGLNPILSANAGAPTGAGGMATGGATASTSQNHQLGNLLGIFSAIANLKNASSTAQQVESINKVNDQKILDLKDQIINRNINTAKSVEETNARIGEIEQKTRELAWTNTKNELLKVTSKDPGFVRTVAHALKMAGDAFINNKEAFSMIFGKIKQMDYNQKSQLLNELWNTDRKKYWIVHDELHPERYKKGA